MWVKKHANARNANPQAEIGGDVVPAVAGPVPDGGRGTALGGAVIGDPFGDRAAIESGDFPLGFRAGGRFAARAFARA